MGNPRSLIVAVALLVVLAGCSAPIGDSSSTDTTAPVPADVEVTETDASEVTFPPGLGPDGITDVYALVGAHHEAIRSRTYRERAVLTPNRTAGQPPIDVTMHRAVVNGTEVQYVERRGEVARDTYIRGGFRVTDRAAVPEYDDPPFTHPSNPLYGLAVEEADAEPVFWQSQGPSFVLAESLQRGDFEYVGTTVRNGTALLVFSGKTPAENGTNPLSPRQRDTEAFQGYLLVSQSGVIHRLAGSYVHERAPRNTTFSYELRFTDERPPKPDWVAELPRPRLEDAGDRAVAFSNTGGAAIPKGALLGVAVRGENVSLEARNLTVPERLPPGETAYLSVVETDDGRRIRITPDRPTDANLVDLSGSWLVVSSIHDIQVMGVRITVGNETAG